MKTSMRSCIVVLAVIMLLPVAVTSNEELVPKLELTVDPDRVVVRKPCPSLDTVFVRFRNAGLSGDITVDWSSMYLVHDPACVAEYLPTGGTVGPIAPQGTDSVAVALSFICECSGRARILFSGVVQGDPVDTDSDTLQVICVKGVPSMSNLGLLILILLLLVSGAYVAYRRQARFVH